MNLIQLESQPYGVLSSAASAQQPFLLCEHCHSPVDRDQRYCVSCGAGQSHARNPAMAYFAASARNLRAPAAPLRPEAGGVLRRALLALALMLLPLGVAGGVLVGRGATSSNNEKLIAALLKQQPVITVPASGGAGASAAQAASGASTGNHSHHATSAAAPVLAHTAYGAVHQISGSRPSAQQVQQDKQIVQKINHTVGKSYVNAQKGLPDTIAVGGGSGSGVGSTSNQSAAEQAAEKAGEH
jgi:hypothetical protein